MVAFRINKSGRSRSVRRDRSSPMKKNAFVNLTPFLLPGHMLFRHMVCPTQWYPIIPGPTSLLLTGYDYVTCIMGVAYKNLSMKSDFSHMPPSRSWFDSEPGVFRTDLNLNNKFKEIGSNALILNVTRINDRYCDRTDMCIFSLCLLFQCLCNKQHSFYCVYLQYLHNTCFTRNIHLVAISK